MFLLFLCFFFPVKKCACWRAVEVQATSRSEGLWGWACQGRGPSTPQWGWEQQWGLLSLSLVTVRQSQERQGAREGDQWRKRWGWRGMGG